MRILTTYISFLIVLLSVFSCQSQPKEQLLEAENFQFRLKSTPNSQLVDVRTPGEFASGHLAGAVNIDFYSPDFEKQLGKLSKENPVFVYCKVGGRSEDAAKILRKNGFNVVYELQGGIMKWTAQNLPLEGQTAKEKNTVTEASLQKLTEGPIPVLIDYYAPWCKPCKKMEPMLDQLKTKWAGKVRIERINVDDAAALVKTLKIEAIPVFSLYVGGKEIKRVQGEQTEEQLTTLLDGYLK